jgi:vancomycin resistance protein YoaR
MADKKSVATKHYQEGDHVPRKRRLPKWLVGIVSALLGIVVLIAGLYAFYSLTYQNRIFPNVMIGSVNVGGLSSSEATHAVDARIGEFMRQELPVQIGNDHVVFSVATVNAAYNAVASVDQALKVGRSGSLWNDALDQLSLLFYPTQSESVVSYQTEDLDMFIDMTSTKFDVAERNASFTYDNGTFTVVPAKNGQRFNRQLLKDHLQQFLKTMRYPDGLTLLLEPTLATVQADQVTLLQPTVEHILQQPITLQYNDFSQQVTPDQISTWLKIVPVGVTVGDGTGLARLDIDKDSILSYIKTISENMTQEPVDAKLTIVDGKASIFQASKDGLVVDDAASVEVIVRVLDERRAGGGQSPSTIKLVATIKKPTISSDTITDLGIKELIGHGETDFSGSPSNRIHNITVGTKYLNGWLVKPGESFSTVKSLGSVDASTGYLPELVIKENKTIPEFGGGLCQVSTTLFRSVLNAGLKVTERRNHSYRVTYYERGIGPGLDATVYLPKPDFQFLNDTPGWILVQGEVKGNTLVFDLYGTKDGRASVIDGPHTISTQTPPPAVYETVSSLAAGETKQTEKAHEGAHTTATYIVTKDGKELFRQTFDSIYKALPAHFLKGADAEAPAVDTAPTQTQDSPSADTPAA